MPATSDLREIWRQSSVPVVFRRARPSPLLVKLPYAADNKSWLRDGQVRKPGWDAEHRAWEIPQAWFEKTVRSCIQRHHQCYVVQLHRERQVCAPACWDAQGLDCECSCMGATHGSGRPDGLWYEVDQAFAVSWGVQRYAVRLIRFKN